MTRRGHPGDAAGDAGVAGTTGWTRTISAGWRTCVTPRRNRPTSVQPAPARARAGCAQRLRVRRPDLLRRGPASRRRPGVPAHHRRSSHLSPRHPRPGRRQSARHPRNPGCPRCPRRHPVGCGRTTGHPAGGVGVTRPATGSVPRGPRHPPPAVRRPRRRGRPGLRPPARRGPHLRDRGRPGLRPPARRGPHLRRRGSGHPRLAPGHPHPRARCRPERPHPHRAPVRRCRDALTALRERLRSALPVPRHRPVARPRPAPAPARAGRSSPPSRVPALPQALRRA
jgi:hypothetical protein